MLETFDCVTCKFVGPSQPALLLPEATVAVSAVTWIGTLFGLTIVIASGWDVPGLSAA